MKGGIPHWIIKKALKQQGAVLGPLRKAVEKYIKENQ